MAKIDKNELDEINAIYEQRKLENHQHKLNAPLKHVINVAVVGAFFIGTVIFMLVGERPTISETEKRVLATFPEFSWESYFSGNYTAGISEFYDDTVPNRDNFKAMSAQLKKLMGITLDSGTVHGDVKPLDQNSTPAVTTGTTAPIVIVTPPPSGETSDTPTTTDDNKPTTPSDETSDTSEPVAETTAETTESKPTATTTSEFVLPTPAQVDELYNQNLQLIYRADGAIYGITLYAGLKDNADGLASSINKFSDSLDDSVNVYSMIGVTANSLYLPDQLKSYSKDERGHIKYYNSLLNDKIKVIDSFAILSNHVKENIYFKTDIHWQQLGAYYVSQQLAKKAGVDFPSLDAYKKVEKECVGNIYTNTKEAILLNDPETFTYYKPQNDYTTEYYDSDYAFQFEYPMMPESDYKESSFYSLFMVSDSYVKKITTDVANGRKLVVFKDSYPSAMIPCLVNSFEEIYVIDVRYCNFNGVSFCNKVGATDVLFGLSSYSAFGDNGTYIEDIRTQ